LRVGIAEVFAMELFGASLTALERAMDTRMATQRVVAANIANVDTAGYTAQRVDFEATMVAAERGQGSAPVVVASQEPATLDGNNVNLESELAELTRNKMMYSISAQIMANKLRQISTVFEQNQ
jgi:flagellar basal-body rod protein FlgB